MLKSLRTYSQFEFNADVFAVTSVTRLGDFWILGNFSKPLATINLPNSPIFLSNFCKGVKINHFSSEIIFGQFLKTFGDFFWSHWL